MIIQSIYWRPVSLVWFPLSNGIVPENIEKSMTSDEVGSSGYCRQGGSVLTASQGVSSASPLTISYPPAPWLSPFLHLRLITGLSLCGVALAQSQKFGRNVVYSRLTKSRCSTIFSRLCEAIFHVREVTPSQGLKYSNVLKAWYSYGFVEIWVNGFYPLSNEFEWIVGWDCVSRNIYPPRTIQCYRKELWLTKSPWCVLMFLDGLLRVCS